MFPVGTGRAGRDSGHERCPSNPALISFIPGTISPSSLPLQPEPLKLTITQSECLFGIIQARGKVRDGGEEGSRFFSARYGPSCGAGVVLEQDECSNNTRQTELGWESSGHRDTRYSRSMGTLPQPMGTLGIPIPLGGLCLLPVSVQAFPGFLASLGRNPLLSRWFFHSVSPTLFYLQPDLLPAPIGHAEAAVGARTGNIHIQTLPWALEGPHPPPAPNQRDPKSQPSSR